MFSKPITLSELAELLQATLAGDGSVAVKAIASLDQAGDGDISFTDEKRIEEAAKSSASAFIVPASMDIESDRPLLKVANVEAAVATLLAHVAPQEDFPVVGIAATAVLAADAKLGENVAIGDHVIIGNGVVIGDDTVLFPGVKIGENVTIGKNCALCEGAVIRHGCELGDRVRIGCNSVIGYDGYGFYFANGVHNKVVHAGNVVIENDVEVGANSCIDRAKWGSTLIGAGSKIDNLVQVAHNVQIGKNVLLVAQVGVAGSTKVGNYVVMGGGAGVKDNITVGDGVKLAAHSALAQSAGPGETLVGTPARDSKRFFREIMSLAKLPDLLKKVKQLEKNVAELSEKK